MANKTTLDLLTDHMRKNDMEVGEALDLICSFVDEFNYSDVFKTWLVTDDVDTQRPLRVKVWQALRELIESNVGVSHTLYDMLISLRDALRVEPKPWDEETLGLVEDKLTLVSNTLGDHSLFNKGGQGYKALKKLRAAR